MDRTAKLWHLEYTFPLRVYAGHEKDVDVVRFHPNCNYLATAGADKTVRLWSHADAKMVSIILKQVSTDTGQRSVARFDNFQRKKFYFIVVQRYLFKNILYTKLDQ